MPTTRAKARPQPTINTAWFLATIADRFGTQQDLAKKMRTHRGKRMDSAQLSRTLRGERALHLDEARQLADLLDVPISEILLRAGIAMADAAMTPAEFADRMTRIAGVVAEDEKHAHKMADRLVHDMLRSLGYGDGADAWKRLGKGKP